MSEAKVELSAPFEPEELMLSVDKSSIEANGSGELFADCSVEILPTAIYERLDAAFGSDGWETSLDPFTSGDRLEGFRCILRVRFSQERVVERTGLALVDSRKPPESRRQIALSLSLQSAAKQVGIGRNISGTVQVPVDAEGNVLDLPDDLVTDGQNSGSVDRQSMNQLEAYDEIPIGVPPEEEPPVTTEIGKAVPFSHYQKRAAGQ